MAKTKAEEAKQKQEPAREHMYISMILRPLTRPRAKAQITAVDQIRKSHCFGATKNEGDDPNSAMLLVSDLSCECSRECIKGDRSKCLNAGVTGDVHVRLIRMQK